MLIRWLTVSFVQAPFLSQVILRKAAQPLRSASEIDALASLTAFIITPASSCLWSTSRHAVPFAITVTVFYSKTDSTIVSTDGSDMSGKEQMFCGTE
jgi:hypothetical protein